MRDYICEGRFFRPRSLGNGDETPFASSFPRHVCERHFVGLSGEQSSPLAHARIIHNRAGSILIPGNRELALFGNSLSEKCGMDLILHIKNKF